LKSQLAQEADRALERSEAAAALEMKLLQHDESSEQSLREARAANDALLKDLEHERGLRTTSDIELAHTKRSLEDKVNSLEGQLAKAQAQLETEREAASLALAQRKVELEAAEAARSQEHVRADAAAEKAEKAQLRVKELEDRLVLPLATPG